MSAARGVLGVLRHRSRFRALFLGLSISRLGDTYSAVAIAWLVLDIAGPRELGLLFMIGAVSRAFSAPLMGNLLDRVGVRTILVVDNVVRAALVAVLPVLAWLDVLQLAHVFVVTFLTGILGTATEIGQDLVVPLLVDDRELESANAALSTTFDLAEWVGPAIGGMTIQLFGIEPALMVNAGTFLVMALTAFALPRQSARRHTTPAASDWRSRLNDVLKGFVLLWRMRTVMVLTVAGFGVLFIDGALQVFWPIYSRETLDVGAASYGLLVSVAGLGSLVGTLFITPRLARIGPARAVALSLFVGGVCLLPFSLLSDLPAALVLGALFGLCVAPFYPIVRSMLQRSTSAEDRGRLFGARAAITACAFPAGGGAAGMVLSLVNPAYVALGVALLHAPLALLVAFSGRWTTRSTTDRPTDDVARIE